MEEEIERAEVVVLGGGPAGMATALALAAGGVAVLVVERSRYDEVRVGETLAPAIQDPLARLGLWQAFAAGDHVPSQGIRSAWGGAEPYERSFLFDPYGNGWHVDRAAFDAALACTAAERGVQVLLESRLISQTRRGAGWSLQIASPQQAFRAEPWFVVDATGRCASFARCMGAERVVTDRLIGAFGFFRRPPGAPVIEEITLVEAAESGWWYSAPLPGDRLVAAFMTDADLCRRGRLREAASWEAQRRSSPLTRERTARLAREGAVRIVPANGFRLAPASGPGWLAVGDAAATCDPLSGDGVHRTLRAGLRAADAILAGRTGDSSLLAEYAHEIQRGFALYLQRRMAYYGRETRWPRTAFWSRRSSERPRTMSKAAYAVL